MHSIYKQVAGALVVGALASSKGRAEIWGLKVHASVYTDMQRDMATVDFRDLVDSRRDGGTRQAGSCASPVDASSTR